MKANLGEELSLKAQIAVEFNTEHSIPPLSVLLKFRKKVAEHLLVSDLEYREQFKELFLYTNEQIKKLIGL